VCWDPRADVVATPPTESNQPFAIITMSSSSPCKDTYRSRDKTVG